MWNAAQNRDGFNLWLLGENDWSEDNNDENRSSTVLFFESSNSCSLWFGRVLSDFTLGMFVIKESFDVTFEWPSEISFLDNFDLSETSIKGFARVSFFCKDESSETTTAPTFVMSRFQFSISPVQVREWTLYTLLRPTPHIVTPVLGLSLWTITKDGAREREIICFGMFK